MNSATPIAENHTRISHALFNEGMRAAENKDYKNSVNKIACILAFIFLAVAAWLLYTGGSLFLLLGEAIFLGALLFWLIFMLPNSRRSSKYKAMARGSDSIPERTTVFYQDHLSVLANNGKETVIPYSDIVNWQETTNLYLINCQNNVSVLLDKKGFVTGDFDVVKELLK